MRNIFANPTRSLGSPRWLVSIGVIGLALAAAACSSPSASPGVASLSPGAQQAANAGSGGSSSSSVSDADPLKFAECMRSHGVVNFPDPNSSGQFVINPSDGINTGSPQWNNAMKACKKYNPNGGTPSPSQQAAMVAQALKYSECMRAHGITDFPDPKVTHSGGGFGIQISLGPGGPGQAGGALDPQSPAFQRAQKTCRSQMPGLKQKGGIIVNGGAAGRSGSGPQSQSGSSGSGQVVTK